MEISDKISNTPFWVSGIAYLCAVMLAITMLLVAVQLTQ